MRSAVSRCVVSRYFALALEMMHQAEDMLMDTWCVIPLYYYNDQYMLKDYVTDVYSKLALSVVTHKTLKAVYCKTSAVNSTV